MNLDLVYVGNCSNDFFINKNINSLGGSAIYSSFSSRKCFDGKIAVICNINDEIKKILNQKRIIHFGNISDDVTKFIIDEHKNTCVVDSFCDKKIEIKTILNIKHLHISFRKGVDFDYILNNKNIIYEKLSIDVMIHSVKDMIPVINKYKNKINMIFCNMEEYSILKDFIREIPIKIITNENKPVSLINNNEIKSFYVQEKSKVISSIGAGDTFIGGFLGKYLITNDINLSINQGIANSSEKLSHFGPINSSITNIFKRKEQLIPNNIIVIGTSCAGKTTFINELKNYYNIYEDIDDLNPLLEMFKIDDILYEGNIKEFYVIKDELKYMNAQWNEYSENLDNINHYTKPSKDGKGHDILRPILWDYIISNSLIDCKKFNIIQFSRGKDLEYENTFKENSYYRCLREIMKKLPYNENTIIINLTSSIDLRKVRNLNRFKNGGHFVSEETMDKVYCDDIFECELSDGIRGKVNVEGIDYPVYYINNNKNLSSIELKKFMEYNIIEMINYYNLYKEDKEYGFKENSKRYLAK